MKALFFLCGILFQIVSIAVIVGAPFGYGPLTDAEEESPTRVVITRTPTVKPRSTKTPTPTRQPRATDTPIPTRPPFVPTNTPFFEEPTWTTEPTLTEPPTAVPTETIPPTSTPCDVDGCPVFPVNPLPCVGNMCGIEAPTQVAKGESPPTDTPLPDVE
jgi:hypothetical protein